MNEADESIRPAWKRGGRRAEPTAQPEPAPPPAPAAGAVPPPAAPEAPAAPVADDDLERGRTLALLAALGRLQMSLDVVVRQQKRHHEEVEARLARIERVLAGGARLASAPPGPAAGTPGGGTTTQLGPGQRAAASTPGDPGSAPGGPAPSVGPAGAVSSG